MPPKKKSRKTSRKKSRNTQLPKPRKQNSLRKHGYSTEKADKTRKTSLKRAAKEYGTVPVIRRLNLARNLQSNKTSGTAKRKMSRDIKWLSEQYKMGKI